MAKEETITGNDLIVNGKRIDMLRVGKVHFVDSHIGRTGKIKGGTWDGPYGKSIKAAGKVNSNDWYAESAQSADRMNCLLPNGSKVEVIGEVRDSKKTRLIWWDLVKFIESPGIGISKDERYWVSATNIEFD